MGWLASVIQRQSSSPGSTAQLPVQVFRRLVVTLRDQQSVSPPERLQHRHFQSTHTETTEPFSQAKQADVGIIHLYCEQLWLWAASFFFLGQGLVTFHILTLQIDNKQFVRVQPGQYMSISSSRFSYLFPDSPSLHYTSLYHCAQMLYICAIVA